MPSPQWATDDVDPTTPSPARVYDVHLGGSHNFAVDREVAAEVAAIMPDLPELLRANRSFLRRAVSYLVERGIDQFLDLGSGIPTVGNVHTVAQGANPASRVVYVDMDPVAVAHSHLMLRDNPLAAAVRGDLREPATVLADPQLRGLLDLRRPVAVLMVAVLHFVSDEDRPAELIGQYLRALTPGSYLVVSHATEGTQPAQQVGDAADRYDRRIGGFRLRDRDEIAPWLTDLELVEPGLAYIAHWRPDGPSTFDPARLPAWGAVGRKP